MFCVYQLPTVIISRRTDQFAKALETLMGAPECCTPTGTAPPSGGGAQIALPVAPGAAAAAAVGGSPRQHQPSAKRQRVTPTSPPGAAAAAGMETGASGDLQQQLHRRLPSQSLPQQLPYSYSLGSLPQLSLGQLQALHTAAQQLPGGPSDLQQFTPEQQELLLMLHQHQQSQQAQPQVPPALQQTLPLWPTVSRYQMSSQPETSTGAPAFQQYCQLAPHVSKPSPLPLLQAPPPAQGQPTNFHTASAPAASAAMLLQRPQPHPIGSAFTLGGSGGSAGDDSAPGGISPDGRHRRALSADSWALAPPQQQQQVQPLQGGLLQPNTSLAHPLVQLLHLRGQQAAPAVTVQLQTHSLTAPGSSQAVTGRSSGQTGGASLDGPQLQLLTSTSVGRQSGAGLRSDNGSGSRSTLDGNSAGMQSLPRSLHTFLVFQAFLRFCTCVRLDVVHGASRQKLVSCLLLHPVESP